MKSNTNLPEFFISMLNNQYNEETINKIIEGYKQKRKVTLRINTLKTDVNTIKEKLDKTKIKYQEVFWSKEALIIENIRESQLQDLDIYKDGEIYLQSLSSMLPPIILNPKENTDILDMAAAPGGKTTQIAALTKNNAHITACEMNNIRAQRLKYNIEKQGANSVYVMQTDSRKIDDFFSFDQILLDAPCSGSGTLNIDDNNLEKTFNNTLIEKCKIWQLQLLKKAIKILKPGKEMVYSTCSILQCENEDIIKEVLKGEKAEVVPIEIKNIEKLPLLPTKIEGTFCVYPNELYEGFFIAKIRKNI